MIRIHQIMNTFAADSRTKSLITSLVKSVKSYAEFVGRESGLIRAAQFRMDGDDYRQYVTGLENTRHSMHEGVISSLVAANRYLFRTYGTEEVPAGGLYDWDPLHLKMLNRDAISEWALAIASDLP